MNKNNLKKFSVFASMFLFGFVFGFGSYALLNNKTRNVDITQFVSVQVVEGDLNWKVKDAEGLLKAMYPSEDLVDAMNSFSERKPDFFEIMASELIPEVKDSEELFEFTFKDKKDIKFSTIKVSK